MPHLTLEYTGNVPEPEDMGKMMLQMHRVLNETGGIRLENCKSRTRRLDSYAVGDGNPDNAFLHLDVRFMAGRSEATKQAIGNALLQILREGFLNADLDLQITVEIQDILANSYFKHPEGTLTPQ